MSKIVNKLQLSNRLKSSYNVAKCQRSNSQSNQDYGLNQVTTKSNLQNPDVLNQIATDCNKPLQSVSWVTTKNKSKYEWGYNSDRHYGVYRAVGNLWLCRDRSTRELSDCEREQIRLYNRLKREYEREQKAVNGDVSSDTSITIEDKAKARKRKVSYFLNKEYYDRIYSCG